MRFPITKSVKLTFEMVSELETIAMYENKDGISDLLRSWVTDKIQGYARNPHYLKKKKEFEVVLKKRMARA